MYLKSNIYEADNDIFNLDDSECWQCFRTKAGECADAKRQSR